MKYELGIFDRIIFGDLFPEFSDREEDCYKAYLTSLARKPERMHIIGFKKIKNRHQQISDHSIHSFHPEFPVSRNSQTSLFDNESLQKLLKTTLKKLNLNATEDIKADYIFDKDKLSLRIIIPEALERLVPNELRYYYYAQLLENEVSKIILSIKETVFRLRTNEEIEHYIHKQQAALENFSLRLIKYLNPAQHKDLYKRAVTFDTTDILSLTFIHLERLLRFFEGEFFKYLDVNIKVPYRSVLLKEMEIEGKLQEVKSFILSAEISERLLRIAFEPLLKFLTITVEERITYNEFIYFNLYISEMHEEFIFQYTKMDEHNLVVFLFKMNMNSLNLFQYHTDIIEEDIAKYEGIPEKLEVLYKHLKTINQVKVRSPAAFDPKLPSINKQVGFWIEEEINYLSNKVTLETKQLPLNFSKTRSGKISVALSVAQLSALFHLFVRVNLITHKNHRDIFRFIADSFQTPKVSEISADSVNSKFYNIEDSTRQALKDYVIKMLNEVNRMI